MSNMINPNGKHTIRPEEAPYEIAYTLLLVTPYYAVFGQHMIQHRAAYPLLLILKDLDSGEVGVLSPPEIRYTLRKKSPKQTKAGSRTEQEVYRQSFVQSDATKKVCSQKCVLFIPKCPFECSFCKMFCTRSIGTIQSTLHTILIGSIWIYFT